MHEGRRLPDAEGMHERSELVDVFILIVEATNPPLMTLDRAAIMVSLLSVACEGGCTVCGE